MSIYKGVLTGLGQPAANATQPFVSGPRGAPPPRPSSLPAHMPLADRSGRFRGTPSPPSTPASKQPVGGWAALSLSLPPPNPRATREPPEETAATPPRLTVPGHQRPKLPTRRSPRPWVGQRSLGPTEPIWFMLSDQSVLYRWMRRCTGQAERKRQPCICRPSPRRQAAFTTPACLPDRWSANSLVPSPVRRIPAHCAWKSSGPDDLRPPSH